MAEAIDTDANRALQLIYEQLCRHAPISPNAREFLVRLADANLPVDKGEMLLTCLGLLGDPGLAPLIERYLTRSDAPRLVHEALRALSRLGLVGKYKDFILRAVSPGFDWDVDDRVRTMAIYAAGSYLKNHRDHDFARMIAKLAGRTDDALSRTHSENHAVTSAEVAAGIAVGVDPLELTDDDDLRTAAVQRFLNERSDG
jgi:hypothetical protein